MRDARRLEAVEGVGGGEVSLDMTVGVYRWKDRLGGQCRSRARDLRSSKAVGLFSLFATLMMVDPVKSAPDRGT